MALKVLLVLVGVLGCWCNPTYGYQKNSYHRPYLLG